MPIFIYLLYIIYTYKVLHHLKLFRVKNLWYDFGGHPQNFDDFFNGLKKGN